VSILQVDLEITGYVRGEEHRLGWLVRNRKSPKIVSHLKKYLAMDQVGWQPPCQKVFGLSLS
jgi:hypothetical protein